MAWGYWSATSVSDRGRSPRREKDKQHQSLHQPSQQQQMHQSELSAQSTYSTVQQERELGPGVAGVATEEPPCSMMIQGGSFYSYSAATAAAAAAAAASRRISVAESGGGPSSSSATSTGIQVLPREHHVKPGAYPPSPGSGDSAEYEQPIIGHLRAADISPPPRIGSPLHHHHHHHHHHHDDIFAQPSTSSRAATKLLPCPPDAAEGMDELSEAEFEEVIVNAELIYGRSIGPAVTCRVHGPCNQQQQLPPLLPESAPSLTSLDVEPMGPSPFQFNEITWGRCSRARKSALLRSFGPCSSHLQRISLMPVMSDLD
ncbi:unnamed protein product [Lasius platythorax]|uniref:Protein kinase c iota type-like protein n=2 Tax=Lasius TaxID=488720 RepID=A0A0J7KAU5_LASNI|nr:protein kinase c iota type-like protein [Lasius niger]